MQVYGPVWAKDDVVGCGWDQMTKRVFYTINGRMIGKYNVLLSIDTNPTPGNAFENVEGNFFAAVGLHTSGARVKVRYPPFPFYYFILF